MGTFEENKTLQFKKSCKFPNSTHFYKLRGGVGGGGGGAFFLNFKNLGTTKKIFIGWV